MVIIPKFEVYETVSTPIDDWDDVKCSPSPSLVFTGGGLHGLSAMIVTY